MAATTGDAGLFFAQLAVLVFVEPSECLHGVFHLSPSDHAVTIRIECREQSIICSTRTAGPAAESTGGSASGCRSTSAASAGRLRGFGRRRRGSAASTATLPSHWFSGFTVCGDPAACPASLSEHIR